MPSLTDKNKKRGVLLRLLGYIAKYWHLFLIAIALTLFSNQLSLLGPKFSGNAIDAIAAPNGVNFSLVQENVVKMIICYLLSAATSYLLAVLMIKISQKIVYTMRKQLFEKLTTLPVGYFDTTSTGDIVSRISYDIDTVNSTLSHDLIHVMTSLYTVVGSLVFMWNISKPMILVFAITVPISFIVTRYRSKKVRPLFQLRSRKLGELNGYAEEMLSGNNTIRAYHREQEFGNRFDAHNTDAMNAYYDAEYYASAMGPSVNFINNLSLSLVMIAGGALYMFSVSGAVQEGTLFLLSLFSIRENLQVR